MSQESFQHLLDRVNNEESHSKPFLPFIYMVPDVLRNVNPDSFNPRQVSIGPLHREDKNVEAFEERKVRYLINLMQRFNSPQDQGMLSNAAFEILKSCMEKAYDSMEQIKGCYVWTKKFSDAEIAEMMVMDACFILEFLSEVHTSFLDKSYQRKLLQFTTIMHDLMLLENQIPLFFLDEMFQCTLSKILSPFPLIELIRPLLNVHNLFTTDLKMDNVSMSADHILSLLHQCYMPPDNIKKDFTNIRIKSAVDLDMAGVKFNPNKDLDMAWVMRMEVKQNRFPSFFGFWSKPTLTMPVLRVGDETEFLLRNLIAYEHTFHTHTYVTAYVVAMDMLVNTKDDVAKLVESSVLTNRMAGSHEEAAKMINNICKNVLWNESFYEEEWEKLNKYCDGYWPKHIAWMRRTYINNPWKIIALVAGIVLFILQVVQTIFTFKSA